MGLVINATLLPCYPANVPVLTVEGRVCLDYRADLEECGKTVTHREFLLGYSSAFHFAILTTSSLHYCK